MSKSVRLGSLLAMLRRNEEFIRERSSGVIVTNNIFDHSVGDDVYVTAPTLPNGCYSPLSTTLFS
jgi:hypothetical protein